MNSAATALQQYRERTEATEDVLGRVVILAQRQAVIRHDELEQILTDHGLADYTPGAPADVDVYRRVTAKAKIQRSKLPVTDETFMNILVRDVTNSDTELVRRIVCELVDAGNQRLSYDGVIDLVYDKQSGRMYRRNAPEFVGLIPGVADTIASEAISAFHANRGRCDDDALRSVATRVVSASHGIKLRETGSVYFVPKSHSEKVEALAKAAKKLPGTQCDLIRLVDEGEGDQRGMVQRAADADIAAAASRLAAEITELSGADTVSARRKASVLREFRLLHERATTHEQLLEQTLDESRIKLAQLEYAITALAIKAEA